MDPRDQWRTETYFHRRDGSTFPVEIHLRCFGLSGEETERDGHDGTEPRFVAISRDVSDRKERERRLQAVFNQTFQFTGL